MEGVALAPAQPVSVGGTCIIVEPKGSIYIFLSNFGTFGG